MTQLFNEDIIQFKLIIHATISDECQILLFNFFETKLMHALKYQKSIDLTTDYILV